MSSDSALTHTDDSVSYSLGFLQNFVRFYFYLYIRQHVNQYWHFFSVLSFAPSHLLSLNDYNSISHIKSVFVFLPSFILLFPSPKQVIKPRVSERVRRTQTERERESEEDKSNHSHNSGLLNYRKLSPPQSGLCASLSNTAVRAAVSKRASFSWHSVVPSLMFSIFSLHSSLNGLINSWSEQTSHFCVLLTLR